MLSVSEALIDLRLVAQLAPEVQQHIACGFVARADEVAEITAALAEIASGELSFAELLMFPVQRLVDFK